MAKPKLFLAHDSCKLHLQSLILTKKKVGHCNSLLWLITLLVQCAFLIHFLFVQGYAGTPGPPGPTGARGARVCHPASHKMIFVLSVVAAKSDLTCNYKQTKNHTATCDILLFMKLNLLFHWMGASHQVIKFSYMFTKRMEPKWVCFSLMDSCFLDCPIC